MEARHGHWQDGFKNISIAALNMHELYSDMGLVISTIKTQPESAFYKVMAAPEFAERDRLAIEAAYKDKVGDEILFKVQIA